jgi:hypothetical protein
LDRTSSALSLRAAATKAFLGPVPSLAFAGDSAGRRTDPKHLGARIGIIAVLHNLEPRRSPVRVRSRLHVQVLTLEAGRCAFSCNMLDVVTSRSAGSSERRPERARDQRRISADAETLHICEQGNAGPTRNAMAVKRSSFFRRSDPWWLALTPKGSSFAGRSSGRVLDLLIVPPGAQGVSDRRPDQNRSRFC